MVVLTEFVVLVMTACLSGVCDRSIDIFYWPASSNHPATIDAEQLHAYLLHNVPFLGMKWYILKQVVGPQQERCHFFSGAEEPRS